MGALPVRIVAAGPVRRLVLVRGHDFVEAQVFSRTLRTRRGWLGFSHNTAAGRELVWSNMLSIYLLLLLLLAIILRSRADGTSRGTTAGHGKDDKGRKRARGSRYQEDPESLDAPRGARRHGLRLRSTL